jgi:hypothetical protein
MGFLIYSTTTFVFGLGHSNSSIVCRQILLMKRLLGQKTRKGVIRNEKDDDYNVRI